MMFCSLLFITVLISLLITAQTQPVWQNGDLTGQMFSVMSGGEVRFRSDSNLTFTGLTVCLRVLSEQPSFSLRLSFINTTDTVSYKALTPQHHHHHHHHHQHHLHINNHRVSFQEASMVMSFHAPYCPWKNRCFTWQASSGLAQLWINNKLSIRKGIARGQVFSGDVELWLPQFEGQLSNVYVWNRAINSGELANFISYNYNIPYGSIVNWARVQYSTRGYVVLESSYPGP